MSVTATIEFDGVPEGYEPVRFGRLKSGDQYIECHGDVCISGCDTERTVRLIVRPIWKPPAWLKPGWIATNGGTVWQWFKIMPKFLGGYWTDGSGVDGKIISPDMLDFTPPPCTEPAKSLREIKRAT